MGKLSHWAILEGIEGLAALGFGGGHRFEGGEVDLKSWATLHAKGSQEWIGPG